jgi:hypothetical protein
MLPSERKTMKRPVGVTVIAVLNTCGAAGLTLREGLFPAQRPHGAYLGFLVILMLFSIGLTVGLLKLRNWARSITILFYWLNLFSSVTAVVAGLAGNGIGIVVVGLLRGLYAGWVLWYLSNPGVTAAFRLRESLEWRKSLSLLYSHSATEGTTATPNSTKRDLEPSENQANPSSITLFGRKIVVPDAPGARPIVKP